MPKIYLILILSLAFSQSSAEVYTWINEEGGREYGDEPPQNAKKANLPIIQTISDKKESDKPALEKKTVKLSPEKEDVFTGYKQLKILYPKEDEMIVASKAGNAVIQIHIEPALEPGHEISLFLDGKQVAEGPKLYFELNNIYRGSHLIQAKIKDKGRLLIASPKRRIHVQRPSILNR